MIARLLIPVALITLVNVSAALEADPLSILIGDPALMGRASSSVSASSSSQNSKVYDDFTIREDLRFTIRAVYNGEDKPSSMGVRGSGLGLSWSSTTDMEEEDGSDGSVWTLEVVYKSSEQGFACQDCADDDEWTIDTGDYLKFRFFHDDTEMLGVDLKIQLPLSEVSDYFDSHPEFTFHPWFFNTEGRYDSLLVDASSSEYIGTRQLLVYRPPGYDENPRPQYDVIYVIDLNPNNAPLYIDQIEYLFNYEATDAIVIGFGDYIITTEGTSEDRLNLLSMVEGEELFCLEGFYTNGCGGCFPPDVTEDEYYYYMTEGGCGYAKVLGGFADELLDYLLDDVFPSVDDVLDDETDGASRLTEDGDRTILMGYSMGGLFSCYAAWVRPESIGRAACQSSSFWWPRLQTGGEGDYVYYGQYYFLNETLYTNLDNRPRQWILMDVGDQEESEYTHMVLGAQDAYDYMIDLRDFEADRNVWFHVYPGYSHNGDAWMARLWSSFKILTQDRQ